MKEFKRLKDRKGYHGKENVKYKDPGHTRHEISYPEDEPHMKSRVGKKEMHEPEKNFHMGVPDQTDDTLPKKIKRPYMKMEDRPVDQRLVGNLVETKNSKGVKDEDGWENEGPEEMQKDDAPSKEHRKKVVVAVIQRKMKKKKDYKE